MAASGALVLTLSRGVSGNIETLGLVFAVLGAVSFGAYIVLGKPVTKRIEGLGGLALALIIAAAIQTPLGLTFGEPGLWSLSVLGVLAIAGVLSSLIPFAAEMTALRTLPIATFGLLLALEPAVAAIVGFLALGQELSAAQVAGICLVVGAAAGSMGPRGWTRRFTKYDRDVMADPRVEALTNVPLFAGLSAGDLATIADVVEERSAEAGGVLTEQGADGDEFYIVAEGSVEIRQDGHKIGAMGPGDHLGEIALIFGGPRTATAVVTEPSRLLVVGKDDFSAMLQAHPRIEDKILTTVTPTAEPEQARAGLDMAPRPAWDSRLARCCRDGDSHTRGDGRGGNPGPSSPTASGSVGLTTARFRGGPAPSRGSTVPRTWVVNVIPDRGANAGPPLLSFRSNRTVVTVGSEVRFEGALQ